MSADNYKEMLQEVCDKLNNIDSVKETDIINIKNSVESIESLITDTQSKLNFQDIKEKLENISFQLDNCNDALLKDLFNDINSLKDSANNVTNYLENLQNLQNLTMTSAEFEEYQKQQLDLALKTNENIYNELNDIKENISAAPNTESLTNLEEQLSALHKNLVNYIDKLIKNVPECPSLDEIGAIMSDLNSVNQKNIKQTNQLLKDLQAKFKNFQEDFENKDFETQISKISEIYDSLNIIKVWTEKVGYVNQAIENVYARLGENIDFDEVSDKIDIIYENISALNSWSMKMDSVDESTTQIKSQIASLSDFQDVIKNITESINSVKERLDALNIQDFDFEDITDKVDIIYENISMLNDWVSKIDDIVQRTMDLDLRFQKTGDDLNAKLKDVIENLNFNFDDLKDQFTINITDINTDLNLKAKEITSNIDACKENFNNKYDELDDLINTKFDKSNNDISSKFDEINDNVGSKFDEINDNLGSKFDEVNNNVNAKFNEVNDNLNSKFDEISQTVIDNSSSTDKIAQEVPDIKLMLETLASELHAITSSAKSEDEDSYMYTLMDIESDFLKLHKSLDDNQKNTSDDINTLKNCFAELNEDISSISIRTNKLILSADDANKEFKKHLDSFKNVIDSFEHQNHNQELNVKLDVISSNFTDVIKLLNKSVNANNNLNTAFTYLAEWIDATGNLLNNVQKDIADIKSSNKEILIKNLDEVTSPQKNKEDEKENITVINDNISELKSLLTGIIVQLNTALTPDLDSLNERIDKLCEDNDNKLTHLETVLIEKVKAQETKIVSLENKIDNMCEKFNTLVEVMADDSHNYEIKDILNFIASQINANVVNLQNASNSINEVNKKLESFDTNINKIVNYIEED